VPFDRAAFMKAVDEKVKKHGYVSVVVSEGAQDADGRFLSDQGLTDAFGHAQLGGVAPVIADMVKQELGYKYHWAVADYLQRAARHIASKTDVQHAYAVGKEAVKMALAGDNAVMPAITRVSNKPYKWRIDKAPLSKIANVEKKMPKGFVTRNGFGITGKCREYLAPLIKGEDYPPYKNGLPAYVRPKNAQVKKKLPTFNL